LTFLGRSTGGGPAVSADHINDYLRRQFPAAESIAAALDARTWARNAQAPAERQFTSTEKASAR